MTDDGMFLAGENKTQPEKSIHKQMTMEVNVRIFALKLSVIYFVLLFMIANDHD